MTKALIMGEEEMTERVIFVVREHFSLKNTEYNWKTCDLHGNLLPAYQTSLAREGAVVLEGSAICHEQLKNSKVQGN